MNTNLTTVMEEVLCGLAFPENGKLYKKVDKYPIKHWSERHGCLVECTGRMFLNDMDQWEYEVKPIW